MELVFQKRAAKLLLHQTLSLARMLPVRKTNLLHDLVYVGDDALHNE